MQTIDDVENAVEKEKRQTLMVCVAYVTMLWESRWLQCLLENLHNQVLVTQHPECRKNLLEVQYFLARDFSYDKHFRKACAEEADELCGAPDMGAAQDEEDLVIPLR